MAYPTLSIGLPVFNGARHLRGGLDSLLAQDFQDFEVIISDNASTDETENICRTFANNDSRIRYFRNDANIGLNGNHDRVFQLSRGTFFSWMADDIEYHPGMLRRCMETITKAPPSVVLVYPRCAMMSNGRTLVQEPQYSIECRRGRPLRRMQRVVQNIVKVNQLYGIMRTESLRKTRLNGSYASSDNVLLAELALLGEIWEIPEVLFARHIDPDRGTAAVSHDQAAWYEWLDPNHPRSRLTRWIPKRERLVFEYLRSAWHIPLKPGDKVMCLLLAPWLPYWRVLLRVTGPWRMRLGLSRNHSSVPATNRPTARPVPPCSND